MSENKLTDNLFWKDFWESKKDLIFKLPANYTFNRQLGRLIIDRKIKNVIELGGFPGYYSIFLKKYFDLKTTLFDYYIHPEIVQNLLGYNDLTIEDIKIIEADLFTYQPTEKYDLVASFGLIEHFLDTKEIINKHLNFLNEDGSLFITLPNFRGLNGWVQKTFDRYNYDKHFITCMDIDLLTKTASDLGLKDIRVYYDGGFSTWLENKESKSFIVKATVKMIWYFGKLITKIGRFESKIFSPYIVLEARKG